MEDHVAKTIALVQGQVRDLERQLAEKKKIINSLCELAGQPPMYAADEPVSNGSVAIRSDEFYGKALATAVRKILEKRAGAGLGAASVSEIYDSMVKGGYKFDAKSAANAKRSLRISLTKNSVTFHKLPNGNYGLREWYPNARDAAKGTNGSKVVAVAPRPVKMETQPVAPKPIPLLEAVPAKPR
jgi:hypothetical protein